MIGYLKENKKKQRRKKERHDVSIQIYLLIRRNGDIRQMEPILSHFFCLSACLLARLQPRSGEGHPNIGHKYKKAKQSCDARFPYFAFLYYYPQHSRLVEINPIPRKLRMLQQHTHKCNLTIFQQS